MPLYTSGPNSSQSGLSTSHETLRSERLALSMEVCDSCAKFDQDGLCKAHMATYDAILRNIPKLPASLAYFRTPDEGIGLNVDQLEKGESRDPSIPADRVAPGDIHRGRER
jgi:hypothetical protein